MYNLDLDKFWMLPRITSILTDDKGSFCAIGAFNEACGIDQGYDVINDLIGESAADGIVTMNDMGLTDEQQVFLSREASELFPYDYLSKTKYEKEHYFPNPEKAKRMLLEAVRGKVNIITKELSLDNLPSLQEQI